MVGRRSPLRKRCTILDSYPIWETKLIPSVQQLASLTTRPIDQLNKKIKVQSVLNYTLIFQDVLTVSTIILMA